MHGWAPTLSLISRKSILWVLLLRKGTLGPASMPIFNTFVKFKHCINFTDFCQFSPRRIDSPITSPIFWSNLCRLVREEWKLIFIILLLSVWTGPSYHCDLCLLLVHTHLLCVLIQLVSHCFSIDLDWSWCSLSSLAPHCTYPSPDCLPLFVCVHILTKSQGLVLGNSVHTSPSLSVVVGKTVGVDKYWDNAFKLKFIITTKRERDNVVIIKSYFLSDLSPREVKWAKWTLCFEAHQML